MNKIENLKAIQILDSRNKKALEVSVFSSDKVGIFKVPSGASTGIHEALELRDSDGSLNTAVSNIENQIKNKILGLDVLDQKNIDQVLIALDNTKNKTNLGGNSMIGVSIANLKLGASLTDIPTYQYIKNINNLENKNTIPYLYLNLINGGKHANNNLAFQEYHVVPITNDPKEAISIGLSIMNSLKSMLAVKFGVVPLGDEGGFAPPFNFIREPLFLLKHAIEENKLENKVKIALDVAASSFYQDGYYLIDGIKLNSNQLLKLYEELILEFKIYSIEDPFHEEDFDSFRILKNKYHDLIVVGDDLTVTNKERLKQAILHDSINALIIKPNQIGTISETFETIDLALKNNIKIIISHRSGETDDDFIADLAYAYNAFGLKSGAPTKPERLVKYNRLINIIKENE
jgi:enolase